MQRIQVTTGSRLHFGLLRLPPAPEWPDDGTRYFGGAGLMLGEPRVDVAIVLADAWRADGPGADRALLAARRFAAAIRFPERLHVVVRQCPPEHIGLGVGTQLELAVGSAIGRLARSMLDPADIAGLLGRGRRSGIGMAGFIHGGFLIDEGKRHPNEISIVRRMDWPETWTLLLLTPGNADHWHGDREMAVFQSLGNRSNDRMTELLKSFIPAALIARNLATFGEALSEYNSLAGEHFRDVQVGRFSSPVVEDLANWLRVRGAAASGQSSWGPTVFSIWDNPEHMKVVRDEAEARWGKRLNAWNTAAANRGAGIVEV